LDVELCVRLAASPDLLAEVVYPTCKQT
jgi:hypothetical protein